MCLSFLLLPETKERRQRVQQKKTLPDFNFLRNTQLFHTPKKTVESPETVCQQKQECV